jgi:ABC-type lipoprotein export system ATPase subunit
MSEPVEENMMDEEVLLKAVDLTKTYAGKVAALNQVSLRIHSGEFLSVIGPSGSGKSTLLNLLGALDRPTSGEIYFSGEKLSGIRDLDLFRNRMVGFVFQMHNLIPTLSARENIEVPMLVSSSPRRKWRERAIALLEMVGLADWANHLPASLSGGQRQRVP